jgi:hypothetical protein
MSTLAETLAKSEARRRGLDALRKTIAVIPAEMRVELLADLILEIESDNPELVAPPINNEPAPNVSVDTSVEDSDSDESKKLNQKLQAVRAMREHGAPLSAKELSVVLWQSDDKDSAHRASVVLTGLKNKGWAQSAGNAKWALTRRAPM